MQTTIQKIAALVGLLMAVLIAAPFFSSADNAEAGNKITICHATGSPDQPYNEITISVNGVNGHSHHAGDIIPAPAGGCSGQVMESLPTVTLFSAEPSSVNTGTGPFGTSTATWSSTDATACTASASKIMPPNSGIGLVATTTWPGARALSGSLLVNFTIEAGDDIDFVLALTCTGPGGTASATTTVNVFNNTPF